MAPRLTPESMGEAKVPGDPVSTFSVLDLTLDQIAYIEDTSGIPFAQWGDEERPSAKVNALLMSAFTGRPVKETGKMTMREMVAARKAAQSAEPDRDS